MVEKEYYEGLGAVGTEARIHFQRCNSLAKLAMGMNASDDSLENILFYGADSSYDPDPARGHAKDHGSKGLFNRGLYPGKFSLSCKTRLRECGSYVEELNGIQIQTS